MPATCTGAGAAPEINGGNGAGGGVVATRAGADTTLVGVGIGAIFAVTAGAVKGGSGAGAIGGTGCGAAAEASFGKRERRGVTGLTGTGWGAADIGAGATGLGAAAGAAATCFMTCFCGTGFGIGLGAVRVANWALVFPPLRKSSSVYLALSRSAIRPEVTVARSASLLVAGAFAGTDFSAGKDLLSDASATFRVD